MSFGITRWKGWWLAGLLLGYGPLVMAQSKGLDQPILFTSPDGQIVTNAPLPSVQAPGTESEMDLPPSAPVSIFNQPLPNAVARVPVFIPAAPDAPLSLADERKSLKLMTPAQMMHVQTLEQVFGLPERAVDPKNPASPNGENTNLDALNMSSDVPGWAKIITADGMGNGAGSNATENSRGLFSEFFDSTPAHDLFGRSSDKDLDQSAFGQPQTFQTMGPSSPFNNPSLRDGIPSGTPQNNSSLNSTYGSGLNSQSPFDLPKSSSLETLPQLPQLPSLPGQHQNNDSVPVTPSWAPKPAPWLLPTPPLGSMEQRKF